MKRTSTSISSIKTEIPDEKPELRTPRRKTQWGCLSLLIIPTLLFAAARAYEMWYERLPFSVHLRDVFKESGFKVPDYVTDIDGAIGWKDFQGDYPAEVTFTVRAADLSSFIRLPSNYWKHPEKAWVTDSPKPFGSIVAPPGTLVIEEWESSDYQCKYGVNKSLRRIYFSRSST